jgi:hypothetical protein
LPGGFKPLDAGFENGYPQFVAKSTHSGACVVGKCSEKLKGGIFYGFGDDEHIQEHYEVLGVRRWEE